jgi:hypothetical protein
MDGHYTMRLVGETKTTSHAGNYRVHSTQEDATYILLLAKR